MFKKTCKGLKRYALLPAGRIYLIPARLDDCTPTHPDLKKLNWVDLFPDWDEGVRRIERAIDHERSIEKKLAQNTLREFTVVEDNKTLPPYFKIRSGQRNVQLHAGDLAGAHLMNENLRGMDLSKTNLRGANLTAADLSSSILRDANLKGANLERVDLQDSDLQGANMWGVNLWRADLSGVKNLSKAGCLEYTNFYKVRGLSKRDKESITASKITNLGDYGSFFGFFRSTLGMSPKEIESVFPWIRSEHFQSVLTQIA